jgi:predicted RNA binding protein YcfA (HicA-like mRNA interferase family)
MAAGFVLQPRRGRGTHFLLKKPGVRWTISIPAHKEVKRQLLSAQIRNAGLTDEQYVEYFRSV